MTRRLSAGTRFDIQFNGNQVRSRLDGSIGSCWPSWWRAAINVTLLALVSGFAVGCVSKDRGSILDVGDSDHYQSFVNQTYYPGSADWGETEHYFSDAPLTIDDDDDPRFKTPTAYQDKSLQEVIQEAFANSTILRDLGGTILRNPENMLTTYSVAITETDPRFGIEAALSDFDTEFSTNAFFEKNDRQVNNQFFGGGIRTIEQDINDYQAQLSKTAATGTQMFLRSNTNYDANNAPANAFGSAWTTKLEAEVRHPLLQGSGIDFNRIAGPNGVPGAIGGVVIAQTNADISSEDFAIGLRDFISNVENAYWDLYYAYRNLDAKIAARDFSLKVWQEIKAQEGRRGAEADEEALASEQYYRLQAEVENALTGRQIEGTRTRNGASGGAFRNTGGVHRSERRLRYLMGITINDGTLIRPTTEPEMAEISFDWTTVVSEALHHRPELKRQRIRIRQRELELRASKNFLKPRLDAVGRYRWRGFGKDFIDPDGGTAEFDNSIEDLTGGKFQEWQLGFEFSVPLGYRRAWAAVQNSELRLAKERALMKEQERQIIHDLSDAMAELKRAYRVAQTNLNRYAAAKRLLRTLKLAEEVGRPAELDKLLDAQNRVTAAQSRYFLSRTEYHIAIKNINFEKGTLLEYNGLFINNQAPQLQASTLNAPAAGSKRDLKTDEFVKLDTVTTSKAKEPAIPQKPNPQTAQQRKRSTDTETPVRHPVFVETNWKSSTTKKMAPPETKVPVKKAAIKFPIMKPKSAVVPAEFEQEKKNKNKKESDRLVPAIHKTDAKSDVKHGAHLKMLKKTESPDAIIHETKAKSGVKSSVKRKMLKSSPFRFDTKAKKDSAVPTKKDNPTPKLLP